MDQDRVNPAFPLIIKQLSSDEAGILSSLDGHEYDYVFTKPLDRTTMLFGPATIEVDNLPRTALSFPANVPFYLEHLEQLGLASIKQQGNQEPLHGTTSKIRGGALPLSPQTGVRIRAKYMLTDFGKRFVRACRP
jgi:hypothetical protein